MLLSANAPPSTRAERVAWARRRAARGQTATENFNWRPLLYVAVMIAAILAVPAMSAVSTRMGGRRR